MQKKKNRFWLFILSLIPGAGQMYLGFMKMGVSFMLGFAGLIAFAAITNMGVLAIFPVVLYVYSFFHANNLGGLSDEAFAAMKDEYLFGLGGIDGIEEFRIGLVEKYRKIVAAVLLFLGVIMLGNVVLDILVDIFGYDNRYMQIVCYYLYDVFPRALFAAAVIWVGASLLRGKKKTFTADPDSAAELQDTAAARGIGDKED